MIILAERSNVDAINKSMPLTKKKGRKKRKEKKKEKETLQPGICVGCNCNQGAKCFFSFKAWRRNQCKMGQRRILLRLCEPSTLPAVIGRRIESGLHAAARYQGMTLSMQVPNRSDEARSRPFVIGYPLFIS